MRNGAKLGQRHYIWGMTKTSGLDRESYTTTTIFAQVETMKSIEALSYVFLTWVAMVVVCNAQGK